MRLLDFVQHPVNISECWNVPTLLDVAPPVRQREQLVVLFLSRSSENPDLYALSFPLGPLELLGPGERVALGTFAVDPALTPLRVKTVKVREPGLILAAMRVLNQPPAGTHERDEILLDEPFRTMFWFANVTHAGHPCSSALILTVLLPPFFSAQLAIDSFQVMPIKGT